MHGDLFRPMPMPVVGPTKPDWELPHYVKNIHQSFMNYLSSLGGKIYDESYEAFLISFKKMLPGGTLATKDRYSREIKTMSGKTRPVILTLPGLEQCRQYFVEQVVRDKFISFDEEAGDGI